jgi:hypothetical protein
MDKQRSKAIESLEISDDGGHVKCQGCGNLQPIIKDNTKLITTANSGRIYNLQTRIRHAEKYNVNSCKKRGTRRPARRRKKTFSEEFHCIVLKSQAIDWCVPSVGKRPIGPIERNKQ